MEQQQLMETSNRTSRRGRRTQATVWGAMTKSRNLFGHQLPKFQDLECKIECIKQAALLTYTDPTRVWYDIQTEANALTNLMNFNARCKELDLDPNIVAQHVIFEGKVIAGKVKNDGLDSALGERVQMFTHALCTQ